jgi:hypothetical protein
MPGAPRRVWKVVGLLAALLVLGLLVGIPIVLQLYLSTEYVEERLEEVIGRSVSVERVGLSFRPDLRVRAQGLVIEPDFRVGAVEFALRPTALLAGRLEARRMIFDGVRAELPPSEDEGDAFAALGELSLDPLYAVPALSFENSELVVPDGEPLPLRIRIDRLAIDLVRPEEPAALEVRGHLGRGDGASAFEGTVAVPRIDPEQPLGLQSGTFRLEAREFRPSEFRAALVGALGKDWRADALDVEIEGTRAQGAVSQLELALVLKSGSVRVRAARVDGPARARARLVWEAGAAKFPELALRAAGMRWGEHRFRSPRLELAWNGEWLDVAEARAEAYLGALDLRGSNYKIGRWAESLHLDVREVGALRAVGRARLSFPDGTDSPPRAEEIDLAELSLRGILGELDSGDGASLPAQIARVAWRGASEEEAPVLELDGDVDGGKVRFRAAVGAAGPSQLGFYDVGLDVSAMDPSQLRSVWERYVRAGEVDNLIEGTIRIAESPERGFECELDLAQSAGVSELFGIRLEGAAHFAGNLLRQGTEKLHLDDAMARAARAKWQGHQTESATATFSWAGDELRFETLAFRAYGGLWNLSGATKLGDSPWIHVSGGFEDVSVLAFSARTKSEAAATQLASRGELELRWNPEAQQLEPLSGGGTLEARGGAFRGQKLLAAVAGGLLGAVPGLRGASQRVDPDTENPLRNGRGVFRVDAGRLRFDPLDLSTGDYDLDGSGWLAPDGSIDVRGDLTLTPAGVSKTTHRITASVPFKEAFRLPAVPVQIQGSLYDWDSLEARADMKAIPVATLRGILGLPGRAGSLVRDAGKAARRMGKAAAGVVTGDPEVNKE